MERVHTKASSKIKRLGLRETEKAPLTKIDEKPTEGTSTSKKDQDGHGTMKSENFKGILYIQSPNPDDNLKIFFCQDGHGVMNVFFFLDRVFSDEFFKRFRTRVVETTVCTTGCVTHLSHAHFSEHSAITAYFAHLHACHIHAWLKLKSCQKGVCCTCIIPLHLAFSISCFTRLWSSGTSTSTFPFQSTILPYFPVLKAQDMLHSAHASRSLATWPLPMQT